MTNPVDDFPYVQECFECGGKGYFEWREPDEIVAWDGDVIRMIPHTAPCEVCKGRGRIIPRTWTATDE